MIVPRLGLRLDPARSTRDQIRTAAKLGARGVVFDAAGELGPAALTESGRREVRHLLRSVEIHLTALSLPTRRPFDSLDQLEDRLRRADAAFALAYELGTRLVLARVGAIPPADETDRRIAFRTALGELGRRADHRGVVFALEMGGEPASGVVEFLNELEIPALAASVDPSATLSQGVDPSKLARTLDARLAHVYATDANQTPRTPGGRPGRLAVDWEELLGSLEEVGYRGDLTVWPEPGQDPQTAFAAALQRFGSF